MKEFIANQKYEVQANVGCEIKYAALVGNTTNTGLEEVKFFDANLQLVELPRKKNVRVCVQHGVCLFKAKVLGANIICKADGIKKAEETRQEVKQIILDKISSIENIIRTALEQLDILRSEINELDEAEVKTTAIVSNELPIMNEEEAWKFIAGDPDLVAMATFSAGSSYKEFALAGNMMSSLAKDEWMPVHWLVPFLWEYQDGAEEQEAEEILHNYLLGLALDSNILYDTDKRLIKCLV
jgi:hypothetical protein